MEIEHIAYRFDSWKVPARQREVHFVVESSSHKSGEGPFTYAKYNPRTEVIKTYVDVDERDPLLTQNDQGEKRTISPLDTAVFIFDNLIYGRLEYAQVPKELKRYAIHLTGNRRLRFPIPERIPIKSNANLPSFGVRKLHSHIEKLHPQSR